jgi:hypothetical protein
MRQKVQQKPLKETGSEDLIIAPTNKKDVAKVVKSEATLKDGADLS